MDCFPRLTLRYGDTELISESRLGAFVASAAFGCVTGALVGSRDKIGLFNGGVVGILMGVATYMVGVYSNAAYEDIREERLFPDMTISVLPSRLVQVNVR